MPEDVRPIELRVAWTTLVKIAVFVLLVALVVKLIPLLALIFVAAMIAVVLSAGASWLERFRLRRGMALTIVSIVAFALMGFVLFGVVPTMFSEIRQLVAAVPKIAERLSREMPAIAPYVKSIATQIKSPPKPGDMKEWLSRGAMAGWYAIEGISAIFLTLVIAVYFAAEGRRALAWLFSLAPAETRKRLVMTAEEVEPLMLAYMTGQLITSSLAAAVSLAATIPMHVPAAVPLAALAFVGDFVPVLGFIAAVVPAALLAVTVSPMALFVVVGAYIAYKVVEDYFVTPHVYGRAMRLSTLTVILTVAVGAALAGPVGAVLLLPIVAAYPPIERIWLRPHLPADTVPKHDAIEGEDQQRAEEVAKDVLNP